MFGKPASGGGPGGGGSGGPQARVTISERKERMSEEQWLCLMVNVLGGVRYDEMDPGVKCFYNSIPIRTMLNNESMRGIGDGGGDGTKKCTLSFYLFIEAVARVAEIAEVAVVEAIGWDKGFAQTTCPTLCFGEANVQRTTDERPLTWPLT